MLHYLGNSGKPLEINLDWMIFNSAGARSHFNSELNDAMEYAEELTTLNKLKGFRIVGSWEPGRNHKADSGNWFYAVGDYDAVGSASVKVLPNCEYQMEFTFTFFDRYNWDLKKVVDIMGNVVTDYELGRLHRVGLAHEFEMTGTKPITVRWRKGERFDTDKSEITDSSGRTGR